MTEQLPDVQAYVLLDEPPRDMGHVLGAIQPELAEKYAGLELQPSMNIGANGSDVTIGAFATAVDDDALTRDLAVSPMRTRLEPVVAGHQGYVRLQTSVSPGDFRDALHTWTNLLAYLIDGLDAHGVWIPQHMTVTTDVLFIGQLEDNPALNFVGTHGMWLDRDQGISCAVTAGLEALGGSELQVRSDLAPGELFTQLRAAVADELGEGRLPGIGETLVIGGITHRLTAGSSLLDEGFAIDLVPEPDAVASVEQAATPKKKKRRWLFG